MTLRTIFCCLVAIGIRGLTVGLACAGPITYIESVDGDLPNHGALPTLAFDVGINTVSGNTGTSPFDFTSFAFTIPTGAELVAAQFSLTPAFGSLNHAEWQLLGGSATAFSGTFLEWIHVKPIPGSDTLLGVPYGAGLYNMTGYSLSDSSSAGPHGADFLFTFRVRSLTQPAEVPEPGTMTLLGLGAVGALAIARRRRQSA